MSEHRQHGHQQPADVPRRPGEVHTPDAVQYDRDLNVRGVVVTGISLAVGTLVVLLLSWWLFAGLRRLEKAADPPPPALREVRERHLPPEPRLQSDADGDMRTLRAAEDQMIERPAWIDESQGTVRIPVDLAIDVLVRRGFPVANGNPARTPGSPTTPLPPVPTANTPGTAAAAPPSPRGGPR
jgi:hypothetical protein